MEYLEIIRPYALIIYYVFISVIILLIVLDNKKPEKSFAFVLLILLVPVFGVIIYLLFGAQYQRKKLFTKKRYFEKVYISSIDRDEELMPLSSTHSNYSRIPSLFFNLDQVNFTLKNDLRLLINGEEKFPSLIHDLENAQQSIHLVYYIIEDGNIGQTIIDILCKKAVEGVSVKLVYDDVGSSLSRASLKQLKESGVEAFPYMPVLFSRLAYKANYRNHRKIVIIDNEIGYLGGMNIKDKYINTPDSTLYWRDTHIRIQGASVIDLQYLFISDWYLVSGEKFDLGKVTYRPNAEVNSTIPVSILGSDYDKNNQIIREAFFAMIMAAKEELLISTPYFIPDETILTALTISAKSGIRIRLIIPEKPDIKTAYFASQTYLKALIQIGVEVYLYHKGMMHSKTMVIDGVFCTVGSTNMDQRSFSLNAEVNAFILDNTFAAEMKRSFEEDLKFTHSLSIEDLQNRKWYIKVICSIARLLAPVL